MAFLARHWSLIYADLLSTFLVFPQHPLGYSEPLPPLWNVYGFQRFQDIATIATIALVVAIVAHRRSAGLPSLPPPASVPFLDQSPRKGGTPSVLQQKNEAFCDICDICVFCLVLFMLSGSIQLFIVCWWLVQTHSKNSGQWGWGGKGRTFLFRVSGDVLLTSLSCKPPSCIKKDTQKRLGLTDLIASLWHPQDLLGLNVLYNVVFGWSFVLAEQPTQQIRRISKNYGS